MLLSLVDVKMQMPSLIIVNICVNNHDKGSSIYYVIIFGGLGRPLPPYVICNHLGLPPHVIL